MKRLIAIPFSLVFVLGVFAGQTRYVEPRSHADELRDHFESVGIGSRVVLTVKRGRSRYKVEAELVRIE